MTRRMMFQAIVTKYLGPSNVRGARVKATADAGSVILSWDHALNADENHAKAAYALRDRFGWNGDYYGELVGGGLPRNNAHDYVWVFSPSVGG